MNFKFGVDTFIWAEAYGEEHLWIIPKAKELGFEVIDFAISNPFTFPVEKVKAELERVGIDCVCTTTLTPETNPISPDAEIRAEGVKAMKKCVDICTDLRRCKLCRLGISDEEAKDRGRVELGRRVHEGSCRVRKGNRRCYHLCGMCQPF